ncbi:MAG: S8 family serine peptidase [Bacteroidota bacterium]
MKILKQTIGKTLSLITCLMIGFSSIGQVPYVPGEVLVQLDNDISIEKWMEQQDAFFGQDNFFLLKEKVSQPMNIYLLTFQNNGLTNDQLLFRIRDQRHIINAQFNHYVSLREVPNDGQYNDQWQYNNTGQSGGTPGADIDIEEAWDITTGGLTSEGDTIVVCIIDDGIDNDHEDIIGNLWVNHNEIPNNGLDDDDNGFIDDYRGWETAGNNDNVYDGGGHGTPVAGCVGAQGDNGVGVTGVNWDVELMIVQGGSGVESEVLEAYSYPLSMRQLYNETNGDRGAFVVSTNASWGIDFGQPSDAPLWCAFYDTLGVHGILNCGATINGNQNVDVVGDLPTACPSDYMISVTNMNHNDVKVTGAGYGLETIDLGAFGANTWTVAANNGYGPFGGTSGATPHVAGTIALLYSAPCPELIELAKQNPEAAAELVKEAIFQGVDPNTSLDGITTTGGRLNVKNALDILLLSCGDCVQPYGLEFTNVSDIEATIEWVQADSVDTVELEYQIQGSGMWMDGGAVSSPYTLSNLEACTVYDVRLIGYCDGDSTEYSQTVTIETDGCCENPEEFSLNSNGNEEAFFQWNSVLAALSYNIRIRETGTIDWTEFNTNNTEYTFDNLDECTEYEVQIQLQCDGNNVDYSQSLIFTTLGCGACLDMMYCDISGADNSEEWISEVNVNDISNSSGAGNDGYEDFSGISTDLAQGSEYNVSFTPSFSGQAYPEYFIAWIDYNHNGTFESTEIAFDAGGTSATTVSGTISIPVDAELGITRLRVAMAYNGAPSDCDLNAQFGEVEDYCVNITLPVSIDDIGNFDAQWSIAPNPAKDFVQVIIEPNFAQTPQSLDILSYTGQTIKSIALTQNENLLSINTSDLSAGLYYLVLSANGNRIASKRMTILSE